ncbi:MAG TPA: hypothetical protein DCO89_01480 [Clostridiales bacterium]|nr:hypothetical protein [Clostridiales bacterium]
MKNSRYLKNFWNIIIIILSAIVFSFLLILVCTKNEGLNTFDNQISIFFYNHRVRFADYLFVILSYLGETPTIAVFCIILLILPSRKKLGIPVTILTFISAALNLIIKLTVVRARPEGYFLTEPTLFYSMPTSSSFPSGHSQTANVFYLSLAFLSFKYIKKDPIKILLTIFITLFCFFMSFARIYLGVHYFSDVWAGISLMVLILSSSILVDRFSFNDSLNIYE